MNSDIKKSQLATTAFRQEGNDECVSIRNLRSKFAYYRVWKIILRKIIDLFNLIDSLK